MWIEHNNSSVVLLVSDPDKGFKDDVYSNDVDAYFIQVNVVNNYDGTQDTDNITSICESIRSVNQRAPVWIRSTITPSTFEKLNGKYHVNYMPEFLSERTAQEDFNTIEMVYTPNDNKSELKLLKTIFNNRPGIEVSNIEAIYAKYFHNIYGAMKITYFNCIYDMCIKSGVDFSVVKQCMMVPGHTTSLYTKVPGPDGKLGYGGKCFPKDTIAFLAENPDSMLNIFLNRMPDINKEIRGNEN